MALKVVFVYPSISHLGFDSFGWQSEGTWISLGLCSISAYAKEHGYSPELIDLRKLKGWKEFKEKIIEKKPDVVGITMLSVDYNPVMKCIDIIKKANPETKIIVGGPHPSLELEEVSSNKKIDYIITGEAEISFTELLKKIEKGEKNERIIQGIKPDLDKLPFADRELFDYKLTINHGPPMLDFITPFVDIIAGRGCIYNCSFCQPAERKIFGLPLRRRSVDNVIAELKQLREKYDFKSLVIHDDCLTEDKKWVLEFCKKYKENGFNQPFACLSRADIIVRNEDLIKTMKEAGMKSISIGFESGSQRMLNFIRKGTTVEQNIQAAKICKKLGIKIMADYMFGIPTETKEEQLMTVKMIKEINPDLHSAAYFTPYPGSDLYYYCREKNLTLIKNHDDYRRNPSNAKIRGIDYKFLEKLVFEIETSNMTKTQKIIYSLRKLASENKIAREIAKKAKKIRIINNAIEKTQIASTAKKVA